MPRTYRFDHFTVPKHEAPTQPEDVKTRAVQARGAPSNGRPRYGKRFAETEEMAHVRQMNQQLEELAGMASPKLSTPREPERPAPGSRVAPIGAMPIPIAAGVPGLPPEPEGLRDLLGMGARNLRLIRHCVADGVSAGFHLAGLPFRAAKLTARWARSGFGLLQPRPA